MVFFVEAFGSWLVERFAEAGRRRLSWLLLGTEQERALHAAGQAAIERTVSELHGDATERAEGLARVLGEIFQAPATSPMSLQAHSTLLEALHADMAAQLSVLGDPSLTGTGQSSAEVLGVSAQQITEVLVRATVQEILARGAGGGPLTPLAEQLNHDLTHLQGQQTAGMLEQLFGELSRNRDVLAALTPCTGYRARSFGKSHTHRHQ